MANLINTLIVFRIIKMLTQKWVDTDAYKLGLITGKGKRTEKEPKTSEEKSAYSMLHKLVFNLKRIIEKVPFGKSRFASYAVAIALLKEETGITAEQAEELCEKVYRHIKDTGEFDVDDLHEANQVMTLDVGRHYHLRRNLEEQNGVTYPQKTPITVIAEHSIVFGVNIYIAQCGVERILVTEDDVY
jgi:hypothetical protein